MHSRFSAALRSAITTSGMSLAAVADRLRDRGTPVSASTLCGWQSGTNHPERPASLAAVASLEELLGLADGELRRALPPRRPRGRWRPPAGTGLSHDRMWDSPAAVERVLAKLDATPEDLYTPARVSRFVRLQLDSAGHELHTVNRLLLRAERPNTRRLILLLRTQSLPQPASVFGTEGCHAGRTRADVPGLLSAFELLLDQPMEAGELRAIEYGMRNPPGQSESSFDVRMPPGGRDLAMEVCFDPDRLPDNSVGFHLPANHRPERVLRRADRPTTRFQFVALDPAPGIYGIRWRWPDSAATEPT